MAFWNGKTEPVDEAGGPPRDVIGGQSLFGLFNKLAMTPRDRSDGFAIQLLGPRPECGVSAIAGALAEFAALNIDGPVALVDANPFNLGQFRRTGERFAVSLEDVGNGRAPLEAAIHRTTIPNLSLLALTGPIGPQRRQSAWTLSISIMSEIIEVLRGRFQWIVVDSAPANDLVFAHVLSRFMDGTVVVVESEKTRLPVTQQLIHQLRTNGGTPLGVVINKRQMLISNFLYRFL